MLVRSIVKRLVPAPVRRAGWQGYYSARNRWLQTVVSCQTTRKIAALTFDDGPNPAGTQPIVEVLARYQARATFFMLGRNVAAHPEIVRRVVQAGHALGNHTFTHRRLVGCSSMTVARELIQCQQAIREAVGAKPKLMRPPFGAQDATAFLTAWLLGYTVVNWAASGDDWNGDPASRVAERVLADIQHGGIILLHDGWEPPAGQIKLGPEQERLQDRMPTLQALSSILEHLQGEGYEFVTVPEMLRVAPPLRRAWFV